MHPQKNTRVSQIFSTLQEQKVQREEIEFKMIGREGMETKKCLRGESNVESIVHLYGTEATDRPTEDSS